MALWYLRWIDVRLSDEIRNNCEQVSDIESTTLNTDTSVCNTETDVNDNDEVIYLLDLNASALFSSNKSEDDITFALLLNMATHLRRDLEGYSMISVYDKVQTGITYRMMCLLQKNNGAGMMH